MVNVCKCLQQDLRTGLDVAGGVTRIANGQTELSTDVPALLCMFVVRIVEID